MVTKIDLFPIEQRFIDSIEKIRDVLKQNKYLAGVLRYTLEERKSLSYWMKNYEERLKIVEVR